MQGAILKAFTYKDSGGNGAGVFLLDKELTNEKKQQIAADIGLSETAFVLMDDENNYNVSFFTPLCEVDLCGHATIAAFFYLGLTGYIKGFNEVKRAYQHTKLGKLEIDAVFKGSTIDYVLMQQQTPQIYDEFDGEDLGEIAGSLNISVENIGLKDLIIKPTIVSTGLKDVIIPVKSRDILNKLDVNMKLINDLSHIYDVVGYHVYTIDNNQVFARNFAPRVGIDEECATGTSNGALGCLLYSKNIISDEFSVIQGESMNEASQIFVKVENINGTLDVRVGGKASIVNLFE
ncbi:PhzF family phenazine biosynthesis protein [Sedimentibacter hydroxybenzoicus DSM 7310]|uniref:PhzF family phenazine biosynthesis protein n=1 Tax=Sedimentibacter hydroxybenzoicus DSM 7310 TaxID=1123245 RepID=A0A974GW36_SEDHY|nr:PhzF family phenazine biosynthesis protein [Sedimentibacter hydroxybenzoicus]NYB74062.1 PhzF family phenazine biosynthesis protein [Sedimentibacter hydroxybenzoicus DSM 7310]